MSENNQTNEPEESSCTGSECSDLLPCPFCGSGAELELYGGRNSNMVSVECNNCFARGEDFNRFADKAVENAKKAWNTRAR